MPGGALDPVQRAMRRPPVLRLAWAAFFLIGWCGVLVPSLVRQVELRYGVDDWAVGVWYFVNAATYAAAAISGGLLTERFGRTAVLPAAAVVFGIGLAVCASVPTWIVFVAGTVPMGVGAGVIDGGVNALVLAVTATGGRGRALNLLHVFVGIGALSAPAVIGQLVEREVPWPAILFATAGAFGLLAIGLRRAPMPPGHRRPGRAEDADARPRPAIEPRPAFSPVPLVLLAVAIGCHVAGLVGVSNWVVRFLDEVPVSVATLALSGLWAGLAVGRLVGATVSDRFPHQAFAAVAAFAAGIATLLAVAAPTNELAMVTFVIAGFAAGPVFPMIVSIGGHLYPDRLAATTGSLIGAAIVGGMVYPPLIGLMSASFGIGTGLAGAGLLGLVCGVALVGVTRFRAPGAASSGRTADDVHR